ncbi:MobF family relaxase [Pseudoxanthomonas winnipegensis]|uniref:MobF family relaxase n=1 Tax=Pseudoxanthomonas winnipegensis TaxID=2480810 RepID=UPI0013F16C9C|nr:MobF family relaxase [Pseudoxanthomonas winnipegensis]
MLNTTYIKGNAGIEYLRASEYYKDGQDRDVSPMVWLGKGLNAVGLTSGTAKDQDFVAVAKGFAPDGTALVQNAGDEERRIGMDWTFTAEKSMSEAMAMADPGLRDQIIAVQHRAVDKAIAFIEQFAEAHREKAGADVEKVQGIIAARVTHFTTRQAEDAVSVDPNLHCHVLVMNVAPREDGTHGAVDQAWMLDYKKAAAALYRAECAQGMQELGFGVTKVVQKDDRGQETGDVFFTLTGMNDEWRAAVSNRRKEILAHVAEHGTTTQQAALATRNKKDEPTFAECLDIWAKTNEKLREQGIALSINDWKGQPNQVQGISDQEVLAKCTEQKAVFTRSELIARIALENVGIKGFDQCLADADRFTKNQQELGELHHIQPDKATHQWRLSGRHEELRMTSREFLTLEREALESAILRRDDQAVRIAPELAHAAIARFEAKHGFAMGEEQRQAVEHVTSGSGGTCIIEGRAGTGKTTVSEAYVDAFRAANRNVIGVAEGWDAATKLEAEAGIKSHSSASLLQELRAGRMHLKSTDVLVVDEAGMVGTRNIRAFQKFCDEAGSKLVLQGDAKQLQPISAGGIFRLIKNEVGAASLTEIRRQKDGKDLKTANLLYKDASLAFKAMDANGQVKAMDTTKEAMGQLVRDYFTNASATRDKLVLVGTLGEGKRVTKMMRDEFKERGTLHGTAYKFRALTGRWYDNIDVQCGDRLRFTKKDMELCVVNGTSGVVDKVDGRFITLRIESDIKAQDGRMVKIDTYKNRNFGHDWVRTVHKSQGQGKDAVFMLANPAMTDTHMGLVGFTRMKKDFALYGSSDDIKAFGKRLGVERLKENAIDQLAEPSAFELTKQKLAQQLELRRQRQEQEQQPEPKRKKQMQMER